MSSTSSRSPSECWGAHAGTAWHLPHARPCAGATEALSTQQGTGGCWVLLLGRAGEHRTALDTNRYSQAGQDAASRLLGWDAVVLGAANASHHQTEGLSGVRQKLLLLLLGHCLSTASAESRLRTRRCQAWGAGPGLGGDRSCLCCCPALLPWVWALWAGASPIPAHPHPVWPCPVPAAGLLSCRPWRAVPVHPWPCRAGVELAPGC